MVNYVVFFKNPYCHYLPRTYWLIWLVIKKNSSLFNEFVCKLGFFGMSGPIQNASETSIFKGSRVPKKAQFPHERVEYNVFFVRRAPLKAPNRLKPLKLA
jgi:hypothetical protein